MLTAGVAAALLVLSCWNSYITAEPHSQDTINQGALKVTDEYPELQKYQGREIGYVMSKDYWGRGLMPEAVREAMRYMFEDAGADFLLCGHFLENRQSARVQQKCGFRYYRNNIHHGITGDREGIMNFISRKQWLEMNEH